MWPSRPIASYSPMGSPRAGATCLCPPDVKYIHTHTHTHTPQPRLLLPSPTSFFKMPYLCSLCSALTFNEAQVPDVEDRLKYTPASDNITVVSFVWCKEFYKTSQELRDSAEGVENGKKCHLCCLFLRSLQSHDSEESTPVPQGPFDLVLEIKGDAISMAIRCAETRGHPLRVDIGAGETSHFF